MIRLNRDTLYSSAVFDLDAGPVTITLPDAGKRFMSMQVINEDHYVPAVDLRRRHAHAHSAKVGTRYVAGRRSAPWSIPSDPKDVQQVHALQDAIKVEQTSGPGKFEVPNWDQASQKKVRDALLVLGATIPDFSDARSARKDEVDPVRHLIGTAAGWGGNPDKDAIYLNVTPSQERRHDGLQAQREGRAGRRLLVDQRLQRRGLLRAKHAQRLFAQQHHGEEERRRLDHHPVRRLRRQDSELPADHEGLELHGAALSSARGDPERQVEIPGGAAGELTGRGRSASSTRSRSSALGAIAEVKSIPRDLCFATRVQLM